MGDIMDIRALEVKLLTHADLSALSAEEQFELLRERAKHFVGETRLLEMLRICKKEGRPMRVKYGIDATGREIHLGHAVPLFVLRRLQNMGHHVVLLIGDFTARVGDPTGRISTRPMLSTEEIAINANRYTAQAGMVLDIKRAEVRFNSEWLESFRLADFFRIVGGLTVATAMQRDDFRKRGSVTRAEMLYSTLMAIDSVHLNSELELGGDDQLLNFYDAERVMQNEGMAPEAAMTTDILLGTTGDGAKMSKSFGNFISILTSAEDMYGKLMSIPDQQMESYFKLLTDIRDAEWDELARGLSGGALHPREVKQLLARVVVADLNGPAAAAAAAEDFRHRIVDKEAPEDLPIKLLPAASAVNWISVLRALDLPNVKSNSDARRLLEGGGVHLITGQEDRVLQISDSIPEVGKETSLRIGKRTYVRFQMVL